jgi:FtsZ-binding cell division protein ZapB
MADENHQRRVLEPKSAVEVFRCALKTNIDHLETALLRENEKLKQENDKLKQEDDKRKQENEKLKRENEKLKRALAKKRVQKPLAATTGTLGIQQFEGSDAEKLAEFYDMAGKA